MKKSTIPYTVMQLKKMYEKSGILDFDCPIQRRYGMWDDYKKSLLPHSMLIGFVIPPLYFTKENKGTRDKKNRPVSNYSCIDGQHRLRSLFSFINDEYALHPETPEVEIDGETYENPDRSGGIPRETGRKSSEDLDQRGQDRPLHHV